MPRLAAILLLALATTVPSAATAQAATTAGDAAGRLHALFESEWQRLLQERPQLASRLGERRYDAAWGDFSLAELARQDARTRAALEALDAIPVDALAEADRLNREMFRRELQGRLDEYAYGDHLLPIDQRGGVQSIQELSEALPFATLADYEHWLERLERVPQLVDDHIELMRAGLARGLVPPRVILQRVPEQVAKQVVADPAQSPFYAPLRAFPASIAEPDRQRLRDAAAATIAGRVVPAYRRLGEFLEGEYLPKCRDSVGVWDTPGGEAWYRNRVRWFTTTDLTPAEVHAIGLREVARIRAEMQAIIARVGFSGSFAEFLAFLRTDERFRYRDPARLLEAYLAMSKRIDPLLPQYFGRLPRMPYGVRPIPDQVAPDTTTAYYQPPALDGRRAGYYYVNLYRPEERPTYEIPVLTIHEAVPGHHLQIALAQELGELPKFRRVAPVTAYVEGWALYSESLGEEMGLYADPYDKFGQLTYEMWRAVRLVVDTGLHHERWSRQQAIDFFKANAPKSELDIVNEIDRYIAWPGQALAYKIGELRIKELRAKAAAALGPRFDLRAFHDVVLGSGAVPLDVLQHNVERWQQAQAADSR